MVEFRVCVGRTLVLAIHRSTFICPELFADPDHHLVIGGIAIIGRALVAFMVDPEHESTQDQNHGQHYHDMRQEAADWGRYGQRGEKS